MNEPIRYVEVSMKLPIDVYQATERKATKAGITAGTYLSHFVTACARAGKENGPKFVLRTRPAKPNPKPEKVTRPAKQRPEKVTRAAGEKRPYVRLAVTDIPELRRMIADNATEREIAARFGISVSSAYKWRRKLADEASESVADAA